MTKDELLLCLTDRPCGACKFHTDRGCSKWSCVFEDKIEEWIPCGERLPEARRSVILSTKEWTGEGCYWETTPNHIIWKGYRWNATYWDDEVTAWMPLPKPWKGEQNDT